MPYIMEKPHAKIAELHEVVQVAANLRRADVVELSLVNPEVDIELVLINSWRVSTKAWSIIHEGNPIGIFGVAPISNGWGSPWMLATPDILKISKEFIKHCPHYVGEMHNEYPNLINYVHSENYVSKRWLRHLGFTLMPAVKVSEEVYFNPFVSTRGIHHV